MFVHNETKLRVHLGRASLEENAGVSFPLRFEPQPAPERVQRFATLCVHVAYRIERDTLAPVEVPLPAELERSFAATATNGTSVTVNGLVHATLRGELARRVTLRVGREQVELVCRSARHWLRGPAGFVPSQATAFEPFALRWEHSFGGTEHTPPGIEPRTRLPHPGYDSMDAYNPGGTGFMTEERRAEGKALPRIELLHDQLLHPLARPIPGNLAPCPELTSMRWRNPLDARTDLGRACHRSPFVGFHVGPLHCIFDDLAAGTELRVEGLLAGNVQLTLPQPRSFVRWDSRGRGASGTRFRAAHLEAEQGVLHLLVQHAILMPGEELPRAAVLGEKR